MWLSSKSLFFLDLWGLGVDEDGGGWWIRIIVSSWLTRWYDEIEELKRSFLAVFVWIIIKKCVLISLQPGVATEVVYAYDEAVFAVYSGPGTESSTALKG